MRFEILNVEHGFCAYAVGSDAGVLLFDCGHGSANRPSTYLPAHDLVAWIIPKDVDDFKGSMQHFT